MALETVRCMPEGVEPRWTHGSDAGLGTAGVPRAASGSGRIVTEAHGPTISRAQCAPGLLYLYVKARSDGSLKPGRPHRLSDFQPRSR